MGDIRRCFVILRLHLDIKLDQKIIQPWPADTEPTAGTALFASEAEYEITITMFAEGKSYIHELHVAESRVHGHLQVLSIQPVYRVIAVHRSFAFLLKTR